MKALVFRDISKIELCELPVPRVTQPDDVLIKVSAVGICGSDLKILEGKHHYKENTVLGHEFCGTVVEIGSHMTHFKVCDRVAVDNNIRCGFCSFCRMGLTSQCVEIKFNAIGVMRNGGYAEYCLVPEKQCYGLPSEIDDILGTVGGGSIMVPALVLAVPIKEDNRIVGVMAAAMTVEDMSKHIAVWKKGNSGFAFLVDDKGFVLSHPKKQLVEKRENLSNHPLIAEFRKKGWTTMSTSFAGEKGQSTLGHVRRSSYGWVLALMQEEQEMFEALAIIQNFALALLVARLLLAAACAWFSARALATPIMKLTDAAERMSLGDLNVKIDVQTRDENGLLAQALGRMQTSLRMAMERLRKKK